MRLDGSYVFYEDDDLLVTDAPAMSDSTWYTNVYSDTLNSAQSGLGNIYNDQTPGQLYIGWLLQRGTFIQYRHMAYTSIALDGDREPRCEVPGEIIIQAQIKTSENQRQRDFTILFLPEDETRNGWRGAYYPGANETDPVVSSFRVRRQSWRMFTDATGKFKIHNESPIRLEVAPTGAIRYIPYPWRS